MFKYVLGRVISSIITLLLIATAVFLILRFIPGTPFTGEIPLHPALEAQILAMHNLDAPLHVQYFNYMMDVLRGNLGVSFQSVGVSVNDMLAAGFPVSARLGLISFGVIILVGIPLGVLAALKRGKWPDYTVSVISTIGIAVPSFVLATFLMYLLGERLSLIPIGGLAEPRAYIGPVIALSGFSIAIIARLTRSSMLDVLGQDYIRTAKANGLSYHKIIFKHALKNALIPVVTVLGPLLAGIITGGFVVEGVFAIPGIGRHLIEAITNRDYSVVTGLTLFFSALFVFMILVVDILYALIDPRIKLK